MRLNATAVAFWAFLGVGGYICDGQHGALVGVFVGLGISVLIDVVRR